MMPSLQHLIDTGDAWRLEGSVGRAAMDAINSGDAMLGPIGHRDFYGNYVPSRYEVEPGSPGSPEYYEAHDPDDDDPPTPHSWGGADTLRERYE